MNWRTEPDGMVTVTLRLPPNIAAVLIAMLTTLIMRTRPRREPDGSWPTLAQQHADALETVLTDGAGTVDTEVVLHVRGDGATCDDGTPVADTIIAELAPDAFIRALVHDADGRPINASSRQWHPTPARSVSSERDRVCIDCGRTEPLEYDHGKPPGSLEVLAGAHNSRDHDAAHELELRCGPCHQRRHRRAA